MRPLKFGLKLFGFSAKVGAGFVLGYLWAETKPVVSKR